jgi:hypothetical protein
MLTVYRDDNYGSLIVEEVGSTLRVRDVDFEAQDFDAALRAIQEYATDVDASAHPEFDGDAAVWELVVPGAAGAVESALAMRGYARDPLSARSIYEADAADVVADRFSAIHPTEAVERALRATIPIIEAALATVGDARVSTVEFRARNTRDDMGRPLPFMYARGLLRRPGGGPMEMEYAVGAQKHLREALYHVPGVVRATVSRVDAVAARWDVALAPTSDVCETYLSAGTTFGDAIVGVRAARIALDVPISEADVREVERRGRACSALTHVARPNSRTIVVRIPGTALGESLVDTGFQARLAWLQEFLAEYGPHYDGSGEAEPLSETSRASMVVTPGLVGGFSRGSFIPARRCKGCKMNIPRYPGRYPSKCPRCAGALEAIEA